MIEKLSEHLIIDNDSNAIGQVPPNIFELMDKINEIIDAINEKDVKTENEIP